MNFDNLFENQKNVVKLIDNSFKNDRLYQTYLFAGPKGSLKMDAALYLASLILCENGGNCGECEDCKRIEKFANPNLYIISPDGDSIKKEQIADLEHEYGYSSDHTRVFIIQDIDKATLSAANTLLKFLEELHEGCYGILITESLNKVIPTIKSRSQIVAFSPISSESVFKGLCEKGIDEEKSKIVSTLTNNKSLASKYSSDKNLDNIIDLVKLISDDFENQESGYLTFNSKGQFLFLLDKEYQKWFADLLVDIQSDKINSLINRKENLVFGSIEYTNIMLLKEKEIEILEIILKFRERLNSYANVDMVFTEMFVEIGKVFE